MANEIRRRKRGEQIYADDWNRVADAIERQIEPAYVGGPDTNIVADVEESVPIYSILEVHDAGTTVVGDETPNVKGREPTSSTKTIILTSQFATTTATGGSPEALHCFVPGNIPFKVDADPADSSFVIGEECGWTPGSKQAKSSGNGLVCLSNPITYETTKKFVWAVGLSGAANKLLQIKTPVGGIPAKTGTGEAGDPYVYGSATCDIIDPTTGLRYSPNRTETIYNQVNVALPGNLQYGCVQAENNMWFVVVGDCQNPPAPPVVETP